MQLYVRQRRQECRCALSPPAVGAGLVPARKGGGVNATQYIHRLKALKTQKNE